MNKKQIKRLIDLEIKNSAVDDFAEGLTTKESHELEKLRDLLEKMK